MNLNKKYNQIVSTVVMTENEKSAMRASLIWHVRSNSVPVKSHFYNLPMFRYGMAFVFLILASGSGVSFASQNALPGDFSYTTKLQIEEIKGITKTTPKQKLIFNKKRAETRLQEMKTLLANDTATPEKIAIASKELESHIQQAKDNATIIAQTSNDTEQKEALIEVKDLEQNIEKDVKVLTALSEEKDTASAKTNDSTTLTDAVSKNKESVTEAIKDIALPKKSETDQLDKDVSNIETSLDTEEVPAGTGEDRLIETTPQAN
ncbi:MAG: hypothetical protein KBB86_01905 [Candidatus Pacebacteria bacterium]|nr:hypothetical protein [Candidatus Paceibacterota bacterium]